MNYIKKIFLLLICFWVCTSYGISQKENLDKKKSSIKFFYHFEANFGTSSCRRMKYKMADTPTLKYELISKFSYKTLVYGVNFSSGIALTHYAKIGLGIGYLFYTQKDDSSPDDIIVYPTTRITHGIPLFLYLRSDFLDKKITPYMDLKIGNNFLVAKESALVYSNNGKFLGDFGKFRLKNGLFLAANAGIAFKDKNSKITTNFSVGYRLISRAHDIPYDFDSTTKKLKYRKTGLLVTDHQFVMNLGVMF